jgi:starch synthase (maltosyl-transferring)
MARAASHITGTAVPDVEGRRRVVVENLRPCVDGGRFCVKRVAGDHIEVTADAFADGHDVVAAVVRHRRDGERRFREVRMESVGNDRFAASFPVEVLGRHSYSVRAWVDRFATWRDQLRRRVCLLYNLTLPTT